MLDEPFGALDAFTREELWTVLQSIWMTRKFTTILVTHDLREAAFLADVIFVMSARPGRVIATHQVDLPRPRTIETTFEPKFIEIIHSIRNEIAQIRSESKAAAPNLKVA
jgi:NitT/TauT family transport system ATP-binding protein